MAHSIELLFDAATEAKLRLIWDGLLTAGLPSQAKVTSPSNRPHVTVAVSEHIHADVDDGLRELRDRFPFACTVGAPLVFGTGRFTLARLVLPTDELMGLHRAVHDRTVSHMAPGPAPRSTPGHWTAHATLARRLRAEEVGAALTVPHVGADLRGSFVGLRRWDGAQRVEYRLI